MGGGGQWPRERAGLGANGVCVGGGGGGGGGQKGQEWR